MREDAHLSLVNVLETLWYDFADMDRPITANDVLDVVRAFCGENVELRTAKDELIRKRGEFCGEIQILLNGVSLLPASVREHLIPAEYSVIG